ncbi:MAG: carbohydrate kinase family protein [Erysipelotrichaceae bacterium]|nr:carbohydrate kinase family protein [Erysipelotrichaceae bacterium]
MSKNKTDVLCIGTALIDSIIKGFDPTPVSASGYRAASGSLHVGGEAVNESMALAKLGKNTAIFCSLGNDQAGNLVVSELERAGVDTSLILRSEHPTPVTTMFVKEDGGRQSITNGAHFYNFHPEKYLSGFSVPKAMILGSLFRAPFDDPEIIRSVLRYAKENSIPVFADTKLPNFRKLTLEDIKDSLPLIDFITPNEDEARYYTHKDTPEEMADVFLSYGVRNVIIKLGGKGCYFKNKEKTILLDAYPIEAVDATGAGDNFLAGLVAELSDQRDIEEALRFANACGAICTTAAGASTALKNREQVLDFLEKHS